MRVPLAAVSLFAAWMLLLSGCAGDTSGEYGLDDSGSEISINTGTSFTIRLDSNPSTGYGWTIDRASTMDIVRLLTSTFEASDSDALGAAGAEVFVFEAVGAGAGVLRLTYERSFDDPPIPERVVEFIVLVDGATWPPDGVAPPATSTDNAPSAALSVTALLETPVDRVVRVNGFVLWDEDGARFCQDLLESYPPQCGRPSVTIANPNALTITLDEAEGMRWTPSSINLDATWDGIALTLG